jgi:hypothetical protein
MVSEGETSVEFVDTLCSLGKFVDVLMKLSRILR